MGDDDAGQDRDHAPTVPYESPPSAPDFAPPPVAGDRGDSVGTALLPVGLLAAGVALLAVAVVAIVLLARSRRAASSGKHAR